jgi:hypothetical protein
MGDCYFISCLLSLVNYSPKAVQSLIVDNGTINGEHIYGVEFFDGSGNPVWVTVDSELPVAPEDSSTPLYASSTNNDIWVNIFEKAFTEAVGDNLIQPSNGNSPQQNIYSCVEGGQGYQIQTLTNFPISVYGDTSLGASSSPFNNSTNVNLDSSNPTVTSNFVTTLTGALNAGKLVIIGSNADSLDPNSIVNFTGAINGSNSTLTVSKISNGKITIGQPIEGNGIPFGTTINGFVSGTNGGVGVYSVSNSENPLPDKIDSETMQTGVQQLVSGHEFYATSAAPGNANNTMVTVYNPWGVQTASQTGNLWESPFTMSVAQLVGLELPQGGDFTIASPTT